MSETVCSRDPIEDIGHGVRVERRYLNGHFEGVAYWHPRPDGKGECNGWIAFRQKWADGWDLVSTQPLHVEPSLLCRACGHHGFIRGGRWVTSAPGPIG